MESEREQPRVFHVLRADALETKQTPYGSVGQIFCGEGLEAVWVSKQDEAVDPGWFSQDRVDLIVVLQGELRVEFKREECAARVLHVGDLLVLPAKTRCRAYRWPRDRQEAAVFLAVYPTQAR